MKKSNVLSSTFWSEFSVVTFKLFQYLVPVEFASDPFTLRNSTLNRRSLRLEENSIHNLPNTHCPSGYTRSFRSFCCPTFIFNLSLRLIKMDPGLVTCDNISHTCQVSRF